jgi:hypothetical protein
MSSKLMRLFEIPLGFASQKRRESSSLMFQMAFQNVSVFFCLAVSAFWEQFSLLVIAAAGAAFLLRKRLKKPAAEDPPLKLYRPRFNQRSGTAFVELRPNPVLRYTSCHCLDPQYEPDKAEAERSGQQCVRPEWQELLFHTEVQDTDSDAWKSLEAYIVKVREEGSDELNPRVGIGSEKWEQIVTLPKSIATLKSVKVLSLYGSHLARIPPEIGDMTNLEEFDPYTSHCLHWFPYEITRCKHLTRSRVSTRCLYGNCKYRPPFPRLPQISPVLIPATCSVCGGPFWRGQIHQAWISLRVATDVLPLLVDACSEECIENLPKPAFGYVQRPHVGGLELEQPPARFRHPR